MDFQNLLQIPPYSLNKAEKEKLLTERLVELTEFHRQNCPEYRDMLRTASYDRQTIRSYEDIPFLPVRLFKELTLKSVAQDEVVKTMTSSGTSGQRGSRIFLDRATSSNQQKAMVKIVNEFTGTARMPMVIIDCPSVVKDRKMFSARGAGILGFSIFGSKKIYALNDDMRLDMEGLEAFFDQNKNRKILLFGFTFMVWQYFYKELARLKAEGKTFDLSQAVLIHGGGWKKLAGEAVSPEAFRKALKDVCGIESVHDYYGIPSRDFPQIRIINRAIRTELEKYAELKPYILLLRYERDKDINDVLSSLCDVRVIWGGDSTIMELRKSPLPPRATEVTFADRYSLAVIDSGEYIRRIKADSKAASRTASDFYNDTYLFDQNACTSPRVVAWAGCAREEAKVAFWESLLAIVKQKYPFQPIQAVDKLSTEYLASAAGLGGMKQISQGDNCLVRVQITQLPPKLMDYRGNSGYFYEFDCDDILALRDFCGDPRCQTVGLLGGKSLLEPLIQAGIRGVDRVVPIGYTMDFDLIWDGYNLVERLTRTIQM